MAGLSPTQRTIRALRDQGLVCGIVERFNPHVGPHGIRQDLFGCLDIIALDPEQLTKSASCFQIGTIWEEGQHLTRQGSRTTPDF